MLEIFVVALNFNSNKLCNYVHGAYMQTRQQKMQLWSLQKYYIITGNRYFAAPSGV